MIRNQIQHQIIENKRIKGDQITEIGNNKIEIILDPMTLIQKKKTLLAKIRIKEDLNQMLKIKISKILKVKSLMLIEQNLKKIKKI